VRPSREVCHHADLNTGWKLLDIGVEMHGPRPT
jgi:hypothetical protein